MVQYDKTEQLTNTHYQLQIHWQTFHAIGKFKLCDDLGIFSVIAYSLTVLYMFMNVWPSLFQLDPQFWKISCSSVFPWNIRSCCDKYIYFLREIVLFEHSKILCWINKSCYHYSIRSGRCQSNTQLLDFSFIRSILSSACSLQRKWERWNFRILTLSRLLTRESKV